MSDDMPPWDRFIWTWGKICDSLQREVQYQKHLEERVPRDPQTPEDMITYIKWELWECLLNLDPEVPRDRGGPILKDHFKPLPRIQDGFHAGCCALRAESMLHRLEKLIRLGLGMDLA